MPSLEEIRALFEVSTGEAKEYNGKFDLHGNMIARAIFEGLPKKAKTCLRTVEGICLAGGYIRDRLNNTQVGDMDFWVYGLTDEQKEQRAREAKKKFCKLWSFKKDTEHALNFYDEDSHIRVQLMKKSEDGPYQVISNFTFYCCMFAIYVNSTGTPVLAEHTIAREHALRKRLNIANGGDDEKLLKYSAKLFGKGYEMNPDVLRNIVCSFAKGKRDEY